MAPSAHGLPAPLGTLVYRAGLAAESDVQDALAYAERHGRRLGEVLMQRGLVSERDLTNLLANQRGIASVSLADQEIDPTAASLLSEDECREHLAVPFRFQDGRVVVAVGDPTNDVMFDEFATVGGRETVFVVASRSEIYGAIESHFGKRSPAGDGVRGPTVAPAAPKALSLASVPAVSTAPDSAPAPAAPDSVPVLAEGPGGETSPAPETAPAPADAEAPLHPHAAAHAEVAAVPPPSDPAPAPAHAQSAAVPSASAGDPAPGADPAPAHVQPSAYAEAPAVPAAPDPAPAPAPAHAQPPAVPAAPDPAHAQLPAVPAAADPAPAQVQPLVAPASPAPDPASAVDPAPAPASPAAEPAARSTTFASPPDAGAEPARRDSAQASGDAPDVPLSPVVRPDGAIGSDAAGPDLAATDAADAVALDAVERPAHGDRDVHFRHVDLTFGGVADAAASDGVPPTADTSTASRRVGAEAPGPAAPVAPSPAPALFRVVLHLDGGESLDLDTFDDEAGALAAANGLTTQLADTRSWCRVGRVFIQPSRILAIEVQETPTHRSLERGRFVRANGSGATRSAGDGLS